MDLSDVAARDRVTLPKAAVLIAVFVVFGWLGRESLVAVVASLACIGLVLFMLVTPSSETALFGRPVAAQLALLRAYPAAGTDTVTAGALAEAVRLAAVPPPPLHLVDTPLPNAFLLRKGRESAIGVTKGLVEMLSVEERTAVFLDLLVRRPDSSTPHRNGVAPSVAAADVAAARLLPDPGTLVSALQKVLARDHCIWWADLGSSAYLASESPFASRPRMSQRVLQLRESLGLPDDAVPPPDPQPAYSVEGARAFLTMIDPGYSPGANGIRQVRLADGVDVDVWRQAAIRARGDGVRPDLVIPEILDVLGGENLDLMVDVLASEGGVRVERPHHRRTHQERMDELDAGRRGWREVAGERVVALLGRTAAETAYRLGAVAAGDRLPKVQSALEDMSLAAGVPVPALHVLETGAVNAFLVADGFTVVVGITRGLAVALSVDEQRAVFADLLARLTVGARDAGEDIVVETRVEAADLAAVRLLGDPAPLLSAISIAWAAPHVVQDGSDLGPWVWFFHDGPLDGTPGLVEHPRIRRLREVLGAAGAGSSAG